MLHLDLYDRVWLSGKPPVQRLIAEGFLRFDYRNVEIVLEGRERLPEHPVVLAMNHTDNFNYWPLQYELHRLMRRYTATWVKGKNYESPLVRRFMLVTNNIPVASRGYVVTRDFLNVMGRRPTADEYRALRDAVDEGGLTDARAIPRPVLEQERDMLGRRFWPHRESYAEAVDALMNLFHARFVEKNREAMRLGLDILVFPQGTRSVRLSRGHIGIAQLALHLDVPIVPVGCSGSDLVYPSRSALARPGRIVYRIGEPMRDWGALRPTEPFAPFTRAAESAHRARFQAVVDRVMDAIDGLVDEPYRYSEDRVSDGTEGTRRFV
ncbi:MAG: 1-acyl-sn-glycerol-3-phosphate acyltransferase [Sandaracinaceae bacterium]|nr:1-acyl-sn-glycerol-3-phosphate acyltransferase [Sandaracinaceae bacterium]